MTKTGKIIVTILATTSIVILFMIAGIIYFFSSYTSTYFINEGINYQDLNKKKKNF